MATAGHSVNAFNLSRESQSPRTDPQAQDGAAPDALSQVYHPLSVSTIPEGAIPWPAVEANPDATNVPDEAVIVVEHPDGTADVGIDVSRLPKLSEAQHGGRQAQLALEDEAAASEALRQQQAMIFRATVLRRRRVIFMALLVVDTLFFAASLLYQLLTGGLAGMRRKGLTLKAQQGWHWWLDPRSLTLEEMALSLIVDIIGLTAGLQDKTYLLGLFIILQTIATVLLSLRGFSLFLLMRVVELAGAAVLRTTVFRYLKLVLPEGDFAQLESMFIGFWSYMTTMKGFCGVLCGQENGVLGTSPPTNDPSRERTAGLSTAGPQGQRPESPTRRETTRGNGSSPTAGLVPEAASSPQPQWQLEQQHSAHDAAHTAGAWSNQVLSPVTWSAPPVEATQQLRPLAAVNLQAGIRPPNLGVPGAVAGVEEGSYGVERGADPGYITAAPSAAVAAVPGTLTAQQLRRLHQQLLLTYYRQRLRHYLIRTQGSHQPQGEGQGGGRQQGQLLRDGPQVLGSRSQDLNPGLQQSRGTSQSTGAACSTQGQGQLRTQIQLLQQQTRNLRQQHQERQHRQQQLDIVRQAGGQPAAQRSHSDNPSGATPGNVSTASGNGAVAPVGIVAATPPGREQSPTAAVLAPVSALQQGPPRAPSQSVWDRAVAQLHGLRRAVFQRGLESALRTRIQLRTSNALSPEGYSNSTRTVAQERLGPDASTVPEAQVINAQQPTSSLYQALDSQFALECDARQQSGAERELTLGGIAFSGVLNNPEYGNETSLVSSMTPVEIPLGVRDGAADSTAPGQDAAASSPLLVEQVETPTSATPRQKVALYDCETPGDFEGGSRVRPALLTVTSLPYPQPQSQQPTPTDVLPARSQHSELQQRLQQLLQRNELLLLRLQQPQLTQQQQQQTTGFGGRAPASSGDSGSGPGEQQEDETVTSIALHMAIRETQLLMQQLTHIVTQPPKPQLPMPPSLPQPLPPAQTSDPLAHCPQKDVQQRPSWELQQQIGAAANSGLSGDTLVNGVAAAARAASAAFTREMRKGPNSDRRPVTCHADVPLLQRLPLRPLSPTAQPPAASWAAGPPQTPQPTPQPFPFGSQLGNHFADFQIAATAVSSTAAAGDSSETFVVPLVAERDPGEPVVAHPPTTSPAGGVGGDVDGVSGPGVQGSSRRALLQLFSHPIRVHVQLAKEAAADEWVAGRAAEWMRRAETETSGESGEEGAGGFGRRSEQQRHRGQQPQLVGCQRQELMSLRLAAVAPERHGTEDGAECVRPSPSVNSGMEELLTVHLLEQLSPGRK